MSLEKAIQHGKEKRRPYYRSGKFDKTCRPGGSCPYCRGNRQHKHNRRLTSAKEQTTFHHVQFSNNHADERGEGTPKDSSPRPSDERQEQSAPEGRRKDRNHIK